MNLKTRLKRATFGAMLALLIFAAGAFADTSTVPVTLGVVTGQRTLQVTGSDGTSVGGPVNLAFGNTGSRAPFGTVVTDVTYDRVGYHVYAELSDLYPLVGAGQVDCAATPIGSGAFDVSGVSDLATTDADAVLESLLDLTDGDITDDLTGAITAALPGGTGAIPVQITDAPGLIESVRDDFGGAVITALDALTLMNRTTAAGGAFGSQDAHPTCGGGATTPDKVYLQHAAANTAVDLTALTDAIFAAAATDSNLDPAEAAGAGLLPPGSTAPGGSLYEATESAVRNALIDLGVAPAIVDADLATVTGNVVTDLVATSSDLALSLVGQTGVYPAVHTLNLDRTAIGTPTTGTYHGVMTVTLVDDPDNDSSPTTP